MSPRPSHGRRDAPGESAARGEAAAPAGRDRSGGRGARGAPGATTDQRLLRGARTRWSIARHGADVASAEGLSGLSIGRLAGDLGLSKSGVATLFGTKEQLQLAVVEAARKAYVDAVVRPALAHEPGAGRLRALIDGWFAYAEEPLFPGGCFWAANIPDHDSRPGPVRDALAAQRGEWLALLAEQVRTAVAAGSVGTGAVGTGAVGTGAVGTGSVGARSVGTESVGAGPAVAGPGAGELDPELTAFHLDALFVGTNTALRLGDPDALPRTRRIIDALLAPIL